MNFRDVPNLQKFEQYARSNSDNEVVMDCYKRIREIIAPIPKPRDVLDFHTTAVADLKASCEAVEKSTRLLWACATAIDQVRPRMWNYLPDYSASIEYFLALAHLELMAVTKKHRIAWEEAPDLKP